MRDKTTYHKIEKRYIIDIVGRLDRKRKKIIKRSYQLSEFQYFKGLKTWEETDVIVSFNEIKKLYQEIDKRINEK